MINRIESLFAQRGLRCTRQRKALYEALSATRTHPTADELFRSVGASVSGMSLATVYNTLEAFCDAGLVQKIPGAGVNGSARYDATCDNHLHTRCERTGTVADVPHDISHQILDAIPEQILRDLEDRMGFKIRQVQVELVGEYPAAHANRQ